LKAEGKIPILKKARSQINSIHLKNLLKRLEIDIKENLGVLFHNEILELQEPRHLEIGKEIKNFFTSRAFVMQNTQFEAKIQMNIEYYYQQIFGAKPGFLQKALNNPKLELGSKGKNLIKCNSWCFYFE
jgi:hypothetical protein